jgi:hypothetical protein
MGQSPLNAPGAPHVSQMVFDLTSAASTERLVA